MKLQIENITFYRGVSFSKVFTPLANDGSAVDLSTAKARMMIKENQDDEAAVIDLCTSTSGLEIDAEDDTITAEITSAQSAAFTIEEGFYDLLIEIDGETFISHCGKVRIYKSVTEVPIPDPPPQQPGPGEA
jgi:hypothetical protein